MAKYIHFRLFWGAFDESYKTDEYTGAALVSGGPSAAAGSGVGVRRAQIAFTRTPPGTFDDDVAVMHFDFLNLTGGDPDDTWTAGDYAVTDNAIHTFLNQVLPTVHTSHSVPEIRYYRVGTGVFPPNPPEYIKTLGLPGTSSSQMLPPQVSASITLKTARRKQWGRTYVPGLTATALSGNGILSSAYVNNLATAMTELTDTASAGDMHIGVLSKIAGSFFLAESVQVDNIADVIRRRRWRNATQRVLAT